MHLFHGLIYGGYSSTFVRHKKRLITNLKNQQVSDPEGLSEHDFEQEKEFIDNEAKIRGLSAYEEFHTWECISLRRAFSTLDLVVKDDGDLMALLHYAGRTIFKQSDNEVLAIFRKLKFKMKLGYECWRQRLQLHDLVKQAITKTLEEKKVCAVANLQKYMDD